MALTKTIVVSLAVQLMGHKPITTLDNADDMVTSAEQFYDLLLPSVISNNNWRFAVTIEQLSLAPLTPPPMSMWQNIYYLPSGWLKTIRVYPQNYVWNIYEGGLIYCNWGTQTPVFMEYCFLPDVSQLPYYFVSYFIYEIACAMCLTNAQKPDYFSALQAEKVRQFAMAAAIDAQNRPQYSMVDFPALNNRNITGIIGPQIG